jgi:hypothetical protein
MKQHIKSIYKEIFKVIYPNKKNLLYFFNMNKEVKAVLESITTKDIDKLLEKMTTSYKFKKDIRTSSKILRNLITAPNFRESHINTLLDNNLAFFNVVTDSPEFKPYQSNEFIEQCPCEMDSVHYLLLFLERKRKNRGLLGKKQIDLLLEKSIESLKIERTTKNDLHFWKFVNNISHCPNFTQEHHDYIIDNLRYGYTRTPNIIETFKKHTKIFKMTQARKNTLLKVTAHPQRLKVKNMLNGVNTHTCNFTDSRILKKINPIKHSNNSKWTYNLLDLINKSNKKTTDTSKIRIIISKKDKTKRKSVLSSKTVPSI